MASATLAARARALRRRLAGGRSRVRALLLAGLVLATLGLGALLFVAAGGAPIAASEGHWPVTNWFLRFAMRRAVDVRSNGLRVPALDDPALLVRGAGHYATGCMPCHGAPGEAVSPVVRRMLPVPPELARERSTLAAEELFWIIRHGIKYTAMPGWVAPEREDEIWAMVAFVQRLPELDARQFRALAYGGLAEARGGVVQSPAGLATQPRLSDCMRCHGSDGAGRGDGAFPRLAGQKEAYLRASLRAYARGTRRSGVMQPALAGLDGDQIDRLARYFAGQRGVGPGSRPPADAAAVARGRRLAHAGDPRRRLPSCIECHGPGDHDRNPAYPDLAGQHADYLALQLRLFQANTRGGTGHAPVMHGIAQRLEPRDVDDLAAYYGSLEPTR